MRSLLLLGLLSPLFSADPTGVIIWKATNLQAAEQELAPKLDDRKSAVEEVSKTGDGRILVVHREADSDAEIDEANSRLFVIESGEATVVVGGQVVKPRPGAPGEVRADAIEGGQRVPVVKGDVVLVPANLAHQILIASGKRIVYLEIIQRSPEADEGSAPPPPWNGPKPDLGADIGAGFRACVPGDNSPGGIIVDGYKKMVSHSFTGASCLWARQHSEDSTDAAPDSTKAPPQLGKDMGDGYRACVPGDESPSGTILNGYRKVSHSSPFGVSCGWEKIK